MLDKIRKLNNWVKENTEFIDRGIEETKEKIDENSNNFSIIKFILSFIFLYIIALFLKYLINSTSNEFYKLLIWIIPLIVTYLIFFYPFNKKISNGWRWLIGYPISLYLISIGFLDFTIDFFSILKKIITTKYGIIGILINILLLFTLFDFILGLILLGESLYGLIISVPIFNKKKRSIIKILEDLKKSLEKDLEKANRKLKNIEKETKEFNDMFLTIAQFLATVWKDFSNFLKSNQNINDLIKKLEEIDDIIESSINKAEKELIKNQQNITEEKKVEISRLLKALKDYEKGIKEIFNDYKTFLREVNVLIGFINKKREGEKIKDKELLESLINSFNNLIKIINKNKKERKLFKINLLEVEKISPEFKNVEPILNYLINWQEKIKRYERNITKLERNLLKKYNSINNEIAEIERSLEKIEDKVKSINEFLSQEGVKDQINYLEINEGQDFVNLMNALIVLGTQINAIKSSLDRIKNNIIITGDQLLKKIEDAFVFVDGQTIKEIEFDIEKFENDLEKYKKPLRLQEEIQNNLQTIKEHNTIIKLNSPIGTVSELKIKNKINNTQELQETKENKKEISKLHPKKTFIFLDSKGEQKYYVEMDNKSENETRK